MVSSRSPSGSLKPHYRFRVKAFNESFGVIPYPLLRVSDFDLGHEHLVFAAALWDNRVAPEWRRKASFVFHLPILLVDDEPLVRLFVKTVLLRQGYRVIEAEDGLTAFSLLQDFQGRFSLVVSDIRVPT